MLTITKILCGAAAGFCCGLAAKYWVRFLLKQRGLRYSLTAKTEWLLCIAATVLGGILGGLTEGIPMLVAGLVLLLVSAVITVTDFSHRIIPNPAVLAILLLKLLLAVPALLGVPGFPAFELIPSLIGLAACFVLFSLPGLFGKNVGAGDVKLAAAMGFFLGIYGALLAVVVMGVLVLGYGVVQRQVPVLTFFKSYIPMGPFIAVGMLAAFTASRWLL